MLRPFRPLAKSLRASFLVLLLIGLVTRPVLGLVGELHAMQHVATASGAGHGHLHHGDRTAPHDHDHGHVKGPHALMHQTFAGASVDVLAVQLLLVAPPPCRVPTHSCTSVARSHRSVPFRPPIA